ncbi:hypothetical protein KC332_g13455 [Hortaea werneckii]|nr:hypothetical protein KC358_g13363 [Hortaea werneckii]KAI6808904.1 hypothetical protein KC350_g13141 [Hortaea werneckii]KAI6905282.1 hypothetical protein KC348_g15015 [Hortaea werneckii]KAI6923149.1 hypothetical protein KC341_g14927 [Hortaea werneckii]KAI6959478.1 hypothetical protein KC321_g13398 [Hortaea werneckii]
MMANWLTRFLQVSSFPVTTVIVSTASGSTITQTTSYYATSTEISTTVVYSTGQAPTVTSTIAAQTVTQTTASSYGVTCSTVISTYVSYATSTFVSYATLTTTQPTTVVSTQISSYGVTTTAPGTFNGKNHRANDDCVNSTSIDNYPNSANYGRLYVPLDNPGHRDLYNTVLLSLYVHACQHCFWLYYHGNFSSLSNDHPNITPSIDCREHCLFNDCIYSNSIRTNSGFNGNLYHKLCFDLPDIISGDNNIGQHSASTATETTTASGPTQTVSGPTQTLQGPTQTETGPTQTISGPTQTVSGPTQTQVTTISYVETYTTSYPVTETLSGSTEVTISYATTTVERTVVSSYISTERISVTQTQEVTTTQAASTLYGTTTQPGVTIYGTVIATHERFERYSGRFFVDQ